MDAGTAAIIAAAISSVVGGLTGFFSSYLSSRQAHHYQTEALRQEFFRDRISNILPLRQKALQTVWFTLVQAQRYKTVTDTQKDEYIRLTIWLPESLRLTCIKLCPILTMRNLLPPLKRSLLITLNLLKNL